MFTPCPFQFSLPRAARELSLLNHLGCHSCDMLQQCTGEVEETRIFQAGAPSSTVMQASLVACTSRRPQTAGPLLKPILSCATCRINPPSSQSRPVFLEDRTTSHSDRHGAGHQCCFLNVFSVLHFPMDERWQAST